MVHISEKFQACLDSNNLQIVGPYLGSLVQTEFTHTCGEKFTAYPATLLSGRTTCPCIKRKRSRQRTRNKIVEAALRKGYTVTATANNKKLVSVRCASGHIFTCRKQALFSKHENCSICTGDKLTEQKLQAKKILLERWSKVVSSKNAKANNLEKRAKRLMLEVKEQQAIGLLQLEELSAKIDPVKTRLVQMKISEGKRTPLITGRCANCNHKYVNKTVGFFTRLFSKHAVNSCPCLKKRLGLTERANLYPSKEYQKFLANHNLLLDFLSWRGETKPATQICLICKTVFQSKPNYRCTCPTCTKNRVAQQQRIAPEEVRRRCATLESYGYTILSDINQYTGNYDRLKVRHQCGIEQEVTYGGVFKKGLSCTRCNSHTYSPIRSCKWKGRVFKVQGYEMAAIKYLVCIKKIPLDSIQIYPNPVDYIDISNKQRLYYPDIKVNSRIYEVKSTYWLKANEETWEKNKAKRLAVLSLGLKFSLLLMDKKGDRISVPKNLWSMSFDEVRHAVPNM